MTRIRAQLARLSPGARVALVVLVLFAAWAALAPVVAPYDPAATLSAAKNDAPSLAHLFGTDQYGRDVYSRVVYGARVSLAVAALAVLLSTVVGTAYGMIAGYAGGWIDTVMMRLIDALLSVPRILMLIAVIAVLDQPPLAVLILLIGLTGWFDVSRIVRAQVMALKRREFVVAARSLGVRPASIVRRHILPNVFAPVIVASTLAVGNVILLEAALSYLGIGSRDAPSWGSMFQLASEQAQLGWWAALFPGIAIVATVLAVNALGDALRDALDPRQLHGHLAGESTEPRHG